MAKKSDRIRIEYCKYKRRKDIPEDDDNFSYHMQFVKVYMPSKERSIFEYIDLLEVFAEHPVQVMVTKASVRIEPRHEMVRNYYYRAGVGDYLLKNPIGRISVWSGREFMELFEIVKNPKEADKDGEII
jgi:hypothetical protein